MPREVGKPFSKTRLVAFIGSLTLKIGNCTGSHGPSSLVLSLHADDELVNLHLDVRVIKIHELNIEALGNGGKLDPRLVVSLGRQ